MANAGAVNQSELEVFDPSTCLPRKMETGASKAYLTLNVANSYTEHGAAATDLGLGSCLAMMFSQEKIKSVLDLGGNLQVVAVMPVGFPGQSPGPRPGLPGEGFILKAVQVIKYVYALW